MVDDCVVTNNRCTNLIKKLWNKVKTQASVTKLLGIEMLYKAILFLAVPEIWFTRGVGLSLIFPICFIFGHKFGDHRFLLPYLLYNAIWVFILDLSCLFLAGLLLFMPPFYTNLLAKLPFMSSFENKYSQITFAMLLMAFMAAFFSHVIHRKGTRVYRLMKEEATNRVNDKFGNGA
ncbi:hypothetical protein DdX_02743 [Ditylenchus destructor]|uniref:Uncharacterized protein n=1 Tax=Ditylenchus destructor TaxID=166010 RepID=A0AAD4NDE3_9BILA|nr:hypothetical protein DdX_02743 [Ditylenchus destructor]